VWFWCGPNPFLELAVLDIGESGRFAFDDSHMSLTDGVRGKISDLAIAKNSGGPDTGLQDQFQLLDSSHKTYLHATILMCFRLL
jgi:hypothetical protein